MVFSIIKLFNSDMSLPDPIQLFTLITIICFSAVYALSIGCYMLYLSIFVFLGK